MQSSIYIIILDLSTFIWSFIHAIIHIFSGHFPAISSCVFQPSFPARCCPFFQKAV